MRAMFAIPVLLFALAMPAAFADAGVSIPAGTSVPGCETTNECYIPYEITVNAGETITWYNDDTAAHTVTSGLSVDGPDGLFDSSLFMAGSEFSHNFTESGTFPYFCMVHPWMEGIVVVVDNGDFVISEPVEVVIPDTTEEQQLRDEIRDLRLENRQLKNQITSLENEIDSLKDQIVAMSNEFVYSIQQLNEWFRSQLSSN